MPANLTVAPWVIEQVLPPNKRIVLAGNTAPHGRPRKGTLLADGVTSRNAEIYYDGSDSAPTRFIFGSKNDDIEMNGRWMDKDLGPSGASSMAETFKQLVRDAREVSVQWGDVVSFQGLLVSFVPERESAAEIAWKMRFAVSLDTTTSKTLTVNRPTLSTDLTSGLTDSLTDLPKLTTKFGISLNIAFLDTIEDAVDNVQAFTGQFVDLANQVATLESATASQLSRLRASIGQVRSSLTILQQTLDATEDDFAVSRDAPNTSVQWTSYRAQLAVDLLAAQGSAAQTDVQVARAQRGRNATSTTATDGDTWETLSTSTYGSPAKADALRQANAARYGAKPRMGAKIKLPLRT